METHMRLLLLLVSSGVLVATGTGDRRHGAAPHAAGLKHKHRTQDVGLEGFGTDDEETPENQLKNENFIRNAE